MTSFDELLALERRAAEPTPGELRELRRHVFQRLGLAAAAGVLGISGTAWATLTAVTTVIAAATTSVYWVNTRAVAAESVPASTSVQVGKREAVSKPFEAAGASPVQGLDPEPSPSTPDPSTLTPKAVVSALRPPVIAAVGRPTASSPPGVAAEAVPAASDPFDADLDRLREVSRALNAGRPKDALQLVRMRSGAKSLLASEYQAAEAIALCQLGRGAEARQAIEQFERVAPNSPLARRVRHACKGQ